MDGRMVRPWPERELQSCHRLLGPGESRGLPGERSQLAFTNAPLFSLPPQHPAPAVPPAPHPPPRLPPVHRRRGRQLRQPLRQPHRQPPSQTRATLFPSYGLRPVRVGGLGPGPPHDRTTRSRGRCYGNTVGSGCGAAGATAGLVGLLRWHAVHRMGGTWHRPCALFLKFLFFHKEEE